MDRKRRKFTPEFKAEAVRVLTSGGKPVAQIARELGVHEQTLGRWKKQAEEGAFGVGGGGLLQAEELRRLKRELVRVCEERDILKKALAFFASRSR